MITDKANRKDYIIVGSLWLLSLIPWFWSATHLDIARDLVHANAIAHGDWVTKGPNIGRLFDFAPYWFYLLALPFKLGLNWLGVILFVGLLSGLKFPLAYAYFKSSENAQAGIIACFLLLILGWAQHQWLFPTHTVVTSAAVFALLMMFQAMNEETSNMHMLLGGLFFGLCFHAHPTILPMGVLIFWSLYHQQLGFYQYSKKLLMFGSGTLIVIAPIIYYSQAVDSDYTLGSFLSYLAELNIVNLLQKIPFIFVEIFWGEFGYIVKTNGLGMPWLADIMRLSLVLMLLIIIVCFFRFFRPVLAKYGHVCLTFLLTLLFVTIIRDYTTYYMLWSSAALLVVPVAYVLSLAGKRWLIRYVQVTSAAIGVFLAVSLINNQIKGSTYLDIGRIFGFSIDNKPVQPVYMITAGQRDKVAQFLCDNESVIVHGTLLNNLILDYQGGERLWCPSKSITLSGQAGSKHLTFLPISVIDSLNMTTTNQIGSIGYFPSSAIYPDQPIEVVKDFRTYIPKNKFASKRKEKQLEVERSCQDVLVIHQAYQYLSELPIIEVHAMNGLNIKLLASNLNTFIYGCQSVSEQKVNYKINIDGPGIENIDITAISLLGMLQQ